MKVIGGFLVLALSFVLVNLTWAGQDQDKKKVQPKVYEVTQVTRVELKIDSATTDKDAGYGTKQHAKVFLVKFTKGKTYHINLIAKEDFDPYLYLENSKKKLLDEDDDSGGGLNSLIVFKCPEDGVYRIIATAFEDEDVGEFRLYIEEK